MEVVRRQMTAGELLRMPDDGSRYELVRGELRKMTPAGSAHGRVAMNVGTALNNHVKAHDLGAVYAAETGFVLSKDPDTVRAPDVAFVGRTRLEAVGEVEGFWPEAPDLAVEVVSPGDTYAEVEEKVFDWLAAGTKMVVVVNPRKRTATVYRSSTDIIALAEDAVLDAGDVVPGLKLPLREVFG
jgi:Uma2 family endonuclease